LSELGEAYLRDCIELVGRADEVVNHMPDARGLPAGALPVHALTGFVIGHFGALLFGIRIAYEGLSWGRHVNEYTAAWDLVCRADCPNLGLGIDSFHILAAKTPLDSVEDLDPSRIFLVQLSDFMWQETRTLEERMATARTFRVFPGEGVHTSQLVDLVRRLDTLGYRGDYSFEVFNDDYVQMPLPFVAQRARRAALWLAEEVLKRSMPLPGQLKLRSPSRL
jgi:sugar phosphate isomerase/epimerase